MRTPRPIPELTQADKARFLAKVNKEGPTPSHRPELGPCWLWTAAARPDGYGAFGLNYTTKRWLAFDAHRIAFHIHNGAFDPKLHVCHHCDNPPCCNPAHLFLGTALENSGDMVSKGRSCRGIKHGLRRLTKEQVIEIRASAPSNTETHEEIAGRFGVSRRALEKALHGENWAYLPGAVPKLQMLGEKNPVSKLTENQVREIRELYASASSTMQSIANAFNISIGQVHNIVHRKLWKHLP